MAEIMSAQEEILLDTFLVQGITYWLGLSDFAHEGESFTSLSMDGAPLIWQGLTGGWKVT